MAVPGGSGGAGKHPGNSPERERGRRRRQSHGSEIKKFGDGAVAGGAGILQAHQRSGGPHLLSEYPLTLDKDTTN